MDYEKMFPGRFLKAALFDGRDVLLTVSRVRLEDLPEDRGSRVRGILGFKETKLELVLNRTNAESLKALFGRETDDWLGKRVTFYPARIDSEIAEIAIRVRGSPDIAKSITFDLKLPRKKARPVTLVVTKAPKAGARKDEGEEPPAPGEPETDGAQINF